MSEVRWRKAKGLENPARQERETRTKDLLSRPGMLRSSVGAGMLIVFIVAYIG